MIKARSRFKRMDGQYIGQRYGQVLLRSTGSFVCPRTRSVTLPSTQRCTPLRPCVASARISQPPKMLYRFLFLQRALVLRHPFSYTVVAALGLHTTSEG